MARHWSHEEDELLRTHADKGPGWDGWKRILPGRSYSSICQRRQRIGVQFDVGGKPGRHHRRRHPMHKAAPAPKPSPAAKLGTTWTQEQDEALLRCANAMVEESGHGFNDCAMRVLDLVRAAREEAGGGN